MVSKTQFRLMNKASFYARIRATVPAVDEEMKKANRRSAVAIQGLMKLLAPKGKTMDLVESIVVQETRYTSYLIKAGGAKTTVGGFDYALAQEFGTQNMAPNPFFYPSIRLQRKSTRLRQSRALTAAIKKAGL